eukprot:TRINITY_DN4223_c0_g1_i1.p1 TRINITY_DN4223_c0_g1~~TRINITY_DN4223_c0_g1_i1.p1  ORF type:complete len:507 (+),score=97.36 TRINITY_DN4223_c0_g1_i1:120-1640(+)
MGKVTFRRADNKHMSGSKRSTMTLKPVFVFYEPFLQLYKLSSRASKLTASTSGAVPVKDLNMTMLASLSHTTKDMVQSVLKDLWSHLGNAISSGKSVAIDFGIGVLKSTLTRRVAFQFAGEEVTTRGTPGGPIANILQTRPGISSRQGGRRTATPAQDTRATANGHSNRAVSPRTTAGAGGPDNLAGRPAKGGSTFLAVGGRSASRASDVWQNPVAPSSGDVGSAHGAQRDHRDVAVATNGPGYARLTTARAQQRESKYTPSHASPRSIAGGRTGVASFAFTQPLGDPTMGAAFGGTRELGAPERSRRGVPNAVKDCVTKDAFSRFEQDLAKQKAIEDKEAMASAQQMSALQDAEQRREAERLHRIKNNQEYLKQQIEANSRRKISQRLEVFAEDPDDVPIVSVLPGDKGRDLYKEAEERRRLAQQLEEQVAQKQAQERALREHERAIAAANDRIAAQNQAMEQEQRLARKKQVGNELAATWRQQQQSKELEKKVGVAPKVGTKVA